MGEERREEDNGKKYGRFKGRKRSKNKWEEESEEGSGVEEE